MVRLTHLAGGRKGQVDASPNAVIRLGRSSDCEVRFDAATDPVVSSRHAEIRFDGASWSLHDVGSSNGTLLNGAPVRQHALHHGDVISLGTGMAPQVRFELVEDESAGPARRARGHAAASKGDDDAVDAAARAVQKARAERRATGGASSGKTMFIVLDAIRQTVEHEKTGWRRLAIAGGGTAALVILVLVAIVLFQNAKLNAKVGEKRGMDAEIQKLQAQIGLKDPDDPDLPGLVAKLELLQGQAETLTQDLASTDRGKKAMRKGGAQVVAEGGDLVDRELRRILQIFEANTYAVPRRFKERVAHYLDDWKSRPNALRQTWERRRQYWPYVQRAFIEEGVPEEMAYVAWVESYFQPEICSWAGARGMWQFIPGTARKFGLSVSPDCEGARPVSNAGGLCPCRGTDERVDPYKSTRAGAEYLGALLSEFGSESFMLAIASYNKGEDGMRRVLRQHKLRTRIQRDFWHMYHMKLLPEETLEYVPRIIAAAIIGHNPQEFGLAP